MGQIDQPDGLANQFAALPAAADATRDPDLDLRRHRPYLYVPEALLKGGAERLRKQEFRCAAALNPY